jgi:diguanylate cyclase (GGDEF)-like protein/PAS domain S-box-containing protein
MTKRLDQEHNQNKSHGDLFAISKCSRALLYAKDEQSLLDDICAIICAEAGYPLAWIGYVEHDQACSVSLRSWSGVERDDINQQELIWPSSLAADDPLGIALHSGETTAAEDLSEERNLAPWIEAAFAQGFRSAIALPLKNDQGITFGVLCIYCRQAKAFMPDKIKLFDELAVDLAFTITSLQNHTAILRADQRIIEHEAQLDILKSMDRESEERFRLVFENSPVPIWEEDFSAVKTRLERLKKTAGAALDDYLANHPEIVKECAERVRIVNVNKAALALHEANNKEQLLAGLPQTFVQESYDAFRQELVALSEGLTELLFDGTVQTLTGRRREVSAYFSVCPGFEQSLSKVFVSLVDITERKQAEDSLRLSASVFANSQEGILISDANNRIIDINPAFTHLTGYTRNEVLGQNPSFLSADRHDQEFYDEMWQAINTEGKWQGEIYNRRKSGEEYVELLSVVAVRDEQGKIQHYVGAFTDISQLKQHEADLDRIAHYDVLTSVPNRRLLGDRLERAIARADRLGKSLAVCYLDLDGFKPINDQFGHEGGDRMLVEIARRLESVLRTDDTVARLGGDEFVLLWNDIVNQAECFHALDRILAVVSKPMLLDGDSVSVSVSIGVTLYPDDDADAENLLRHADHAMYSAKQLGKNRYQIFDAYLEQQISSRVELLARVEKGLDQGQFELYYQPKVNYIAGEVDSLEALLRWNDPVLGLVGPKEFLSLIENDSLTFRMGRWVMEQVVCQARIWDDMGIRLPISINVFPRHLKYRNFINDLCNAIALHWPQMPKNRLLVEIIESSDLEDLEPIEQVIKACVEMGIGFSLDDFGTGYSSLVYLRCLSIEELKIDQSFVRDMLDDPDDEAIVIGVIELGRAFGLRVVAEGVESIQQARYLVDLGCSIVQGYGLGRPMPAAMFQKWYADFLNSE